MILPDRLSGRGKYFYLWLRRRDLGFNPCEVY